MGEKDKAQVLPLSKGWWRDERTGTTAKEIRLVRPGIKVFDDAKLYSLAEIADKLEVRPGTVSGWAKQFKLDVQPLPKGIRIWGKHMNELLEKLRIQALQKR